MINNPSTPAVLAGSFRLPERTHMDSASSTFFGAVFQENTAQFATLDTAKAIASILGGTVVDLKDQWTGGAQTSQYGIEMPFGGPVLNAGLIAQRCASCGVEAGLSAAMQEVGAVTGHPIAISDAWASVVAREGALATAPGSAPKQQAATGATPGAQPPALATPAPVNVAPAPASPEVALSAASGAPADPKIASTARQFEALLIGQMLKSARESGSGGWLGSDENSAGVSPVELGEEQLAQSVAAQGGLGLAKLLLDGLNRPQSKASNS